MSTEDALRAEIAATAARLIAEEGCDYGQAKRRAVHDLVGDARSAPVPDNAEVERELRRHLRLFGGDEHATQLAAMRRTAASLMERLAAFDPHLTGAVLNGTATGHSDIHLHLYVDSAKDVEMYLLEAGVEFDVDDGPPDERPRMFERLTFLLPSARHASPPHGGDRIGVQLHVYPRDAIRVAPRFRSDTTLGPDIHPVEASGRANLPALRRLLQDTEA